MKRAGSLHRAGGRAAGGHPLVERLRARRVALGVTGEDLSGRAGIYVGAVSKWERGHSPTLSLFCAAVEALGGRVEVVFPDRPGRGGD
jgi:transcriptional regulator with XRE-family HTH domain